MANSVLDADPHWNGSGSGFALETRGQTYFYHCQGIFETLVPTSEKPEMYRINVLCWRQRLVRIRVRTFMDPHWLSSLELDPDPHWCKMLDVDTDPLFRPVRIRNTDGQKYRIQSRDVRMFFKSYLLIDLARDTHSVPKCIFLTDTTLHYVVVGFGGGVGRGFLHPLID
jgi:hypothetical protein